MSSVTNRQWIVHNSAESTAQRDFSSLRLESAPIPSIGDYELLMRIHAVSLNWRDVMVATDTYLWPIESNTVPCSDGAGEVVAIGSKVTRFGIGDRVAAIFLQEHLGGSLTPAALGSSLGASHHGMLREYAVFNEKGLVSIPSHLSYTEASTLPCAGVTAWNALMGEGRSLQAGDTVVTQGTGGVSIFAAQFAIAAGARVIGTTSSNEKAELLKSLGVHHVINYRETPDWGAQAKKLTPGGEGADFIIEIGGPETIQQSLHAVRPGGHIILIGQRTGQDPKIKSEKSLSLADAFGTICTFRRIIVGSRNQFEEMNRSIAANLIKPVVDETVFAFGDARDAFMYLSEGKQVGNVIIQVE